MTILSTCAKTPARPEAGARAYWRGGHRRGAVGRPTRPPDLDDRGLVDRAPGDGSIAAFLEAGIAAGELVSEDAAQLAFTIVGAHLFYFAVPGVASRALGADLFSDEMRERRRRALIPQSRRLCGIAPR